MKKTILIFGNGYVAKFLSKKLIDLSWIVYISSRKIVPDENIENKNIKIISFSDPKLSEIAKLANVVLSTVPTDPEIIDPVLEKYLKIISEEEFEWVGYLSSTGVYGNHDGAWVNEDTICFPSNNKSKIRLLAEQQWLDLYVKNKIPVHILRLSGIYGPGRNCLEEILRGKDFTIVKENQYFSRIHIEDICLAIIKSINLPTPGEIYNVSDDEPAPINIVQQFGAQILNTKPLKEVLFENANLSKEFSSFFHDNKKVSNKKIVKNLNINWKYPNYRLGLLHGCLPYIVIIPKDYI
jgi:hypothetical protein